MTRLPFPVSLPRSSSDGSISSWLENVNHYRNLYGILEPDHPPKRLKRSSEHKRKALQNELSGYTNPSRKRLRLAMDNEGSDSAAARRSPRLRALNNIPPSVEVHLKRAGESGFINLDPATPVSSRSKSPERRSPERRRGRCRTGLSGIDTASDTISLSSLALSAADVSAPTNTTKARSTSPERLTPQDLTG